MRMTGLQTLFFRRHSLDCRELRLHPNTNAEGHCQSRVIVFIQVTKLLSKIWLLSLLTEILMNGFIP